MYKRFAKRILDIFFSLIFILMLSPVLLGIAILVRVKLGSPVIFHQLRPGKDERIFELKKFRTMTDEKDEDGRLLPDNVRLTDFGKKLRSTSLDELPELWNILKGEMSFVGPRPLLVEYLPRYNEEQHRRHEVRPGLTGLAQSQGRNLLTWEDRFELDIYYVDNMSFLGDMKIIFDTFKAVMKQDGISSGTSETMEMFRGSLDSSRDGGILDE